jgi:hypothetical protein
VRVLVDSHQLQRLTHDRVPDLVHRRHVFQLRVLDDDLLAERLVQGDVDILVDGRGDQKTGVFAVVGRQIGAAATE